MAARLDAATTRIAGVTRTTTKLAVAAEADPRPPVADPADAVSAPVSPELVTLRAPLSPGAEAIRALRTHVLAQHIHAGRRGLVVCAPSVDVGCTFVAANLAVA